MNGAREYHKIISEAVNAKIGNLRKLNRDDAWYMGSSCFIYGNVIYGLNDHARGRCFHIYLAENIKNLTDKEIVSKDNCLEVYGVLGGQKGWTEYYGWKQKGNWTEPIISHLGFLRYETELHYEKIKEKNKLKDEEVQKLIESTVNKFNKIFA